MRAGFGELSRGLDQVGLGGGQGKNLNYIPIVLGTYPIPKRLGDRICFCCFLQDCSVDPWRMS